MEREKELIIVTNNHWRPIIQGSELTEKEKTDFDYLEGDDLENGNFFRYKGMIFYLGEIMRIESDEKYWDGYFNFGVFSGLYVKLHETGEAVKVAYYYS